MDTRLKYRGALVIMVEAMLICFLLTDVARAVTTVFFDSSQSTNLAAVGITSDTIKSEGYLFTLTRDKLFTGGVGLTNPVGRYIRVPWPAGLEAQAVTAGPVHGSARIDIKREDGQTFAMQSFTIRLLANTGGAGAALEVMPMRNGEDGVPEPYMYNATGNYGQEFSYNSPELTGFDAYKVTLYVDFALMDLTAVDASLPPPNLEIIRAGAASIQLSWPINPSGYSPEFATRLPPIGWSPVTNAVMVSGDRFVVEFDATEPGRFYRLKK